MRDDAKSLTAKPFKKRRCGYTLVEVLCVIAIIFTLTAMMTPVFGKAISAARRLVKWVNTTTPAERAGYPGDKSGR